MYKRNVIWTLLVSLSLAVAAKADGPFHVMGTVPLNWQGGAITAQLDEGAHRLFMVQTNQVHVLELNPSRAQSVITNANGFRSFVIAPQMRMGFFVSGTEAIVQAVDLMTGRPKRGIKTEKIVDQIYLSPRNGMLYAFHRDENAVSLFESDDGDFMGKIELPGKPGCVAGDPASGQVYVYLEGINKIGVIDPRKQKLTAQFEIPAKEGVTALAVDSTSRKIFAGFHDGTVMMLGTNGISTGAITLKGAVDMMSFDPVSRFLYVTSDGTLNVINQYTATELRLAQALTVAAGPQAMTVDAKNQRLFLVPLRTDAVNLINVVTMVGR
jgi:DNA-binding beta-propeller fold protein YncE